MMAFFVDWIKNIILLILLATFLDLILPSSQMQRYVKLVMGFLLILMILTPVLQLFQIDQDQLFASLEELTGTKQRESQMRFEKEQEEIEAWQRRAILAEVEERWRQEIKQRIEDEQDVLVQQVSLQLDTDRRDPTKIMVKDLVLTLQQQDTDHRVDSQIKPVQPVQEVYIRVGDKKNNLGQDEPQNTDISRENQGFDDQIEKDILQLVQKEWNISVDKIHIQWIRR